MLSNAQGDPKFRQKIDRIVIGFTWDTERDQGHIEVATGGQSKRTASSHGLDSVIGRDRRSGQAASFASIRTGA